MKLKSNSYLFQGVKIFGKAGNWDISINQDTIENIKKSSKKDGGFITPRFSDIHVHLDKTGTAKRIPQRATSLFDAIDLMHKDKINWTEEDIYFRANKAVKTAFNRGTGFLRTHVDWENETCPLAWKVINDIKFKWAGRVAIQMCSLTSIDVLESVGDIIAKRIKSDGGILGAFIYRNERLDEKIRAAFELATKYDLDLDFHVDEGLDRKAEGFDLIVKSTKDFGMGGKVLCGHACSLSIRDEAEVSKIIKNAAEAKVGLTCLPTTNLWLQDNIEGRTPRLRGLTPVQEARSAGVQVMFASDNCQDPFYPFGDHNILSTLKTAVIGAHLNESEWLDSISTIPAKWMGFKNLISVGAEASFIKFNVQSVYDLFSGVDFKYEVWSNGKLVQN